METPILLGASPKTANLDVLVPIRFDRWSVKVEGLVDSEITLYLNKPIVQYVELAKLNGEVFDGPCQVRVEFMKRGTEKAISVFAVKVEGLGLWL